MRIGLAQINPSLGDFSANRAKILELTSKASQQEVDLVVFPELSLFGYPPLDLLEFHHLVEMQTKELKRLHKSIPRGIGVIVGAIVKNQEKSGKPFRNAAVFLERGKTPKYFYKELLPAYDVFDEARFVEPGSVENGVLKFRGRRLHVSVCEDIWGWPVSGLSSNYRTNPIKTLRGQKFDVLINVSASPYTHRKQKDRLTVTRATAKFLKAPLIYVNCVGAQDELIFDGASFVVDPKGKLRAQCRAFDEDLVVYDLKDGRGDLHAETLSSVEALRRALVLGIRDFIKKTGLTRVHLGLSGGIDSAVVAALAVDALGPHRVTGVTMPGPFNSPVSEELGTRLAKNLGIRCLRMPIESVYQTVMQEVHAALGQFDFGLVDENVQARARGILLMALSNHEGSLLLSTSNKSEYATGYSTLYGDMCGGLAPIGDLLKREVYALARHYNSQDEVIPQEILDRAPSAELRPNQKDQDSLPPYDELDETIENLLVKHKAPKGERDQWLLKTLQRTEFKRWQAPPVLKVSQRAFGRGRRYPIANQFKGFR